MIRLHGKFGENSGIVCIKDVTGTSFWTVKFDDQEPTNLRKAKLVTQLV